MLLQDQWTTEFRKNDRPTEPSLIFERVLCTAICVSNQLGKDRATAYKKMSRFLEQKERTNESETISATTGTSGKFERLAASKHERVYFRRKLLTYLVIRKERVELAFDYDTSLNQNVLFKMVHREEFQEEMFFENRTYSKGIDKELPLTLQLYRKTIELSLVNQTVLCHSISITAQQLICSLKQSAKNAVLTLPLAGNINVQEMKTLMMDTEGLVIARPSMYLPSNSPEGVPLVLQRTLRGQIRAHFGRPPADTTQFNIHGRQDAESRKRSEKMTSYTYAGIATVCGNGIKNAGVNG